MAFAPARPSPVQASRVLGWSARSARERCQKTCSESKDCVPPPPTDPAGFVRRAPTRKGAILDPRGRRAGRRDAVACPRSPRSTEFSCERPQGSQVGAQSSSTTLGSGGLRGTRRSGASRFLDQERYARPVPEATARSRGARASGPGGVAALPQDRAVTICIVDTSILDELLRSARSLARQPPRPSSIEQHLMARRRARPATCGRHDDRLRHVEQDARR